MNYVKKVKEIRGKQNLTQEQLSIKVGISHGIIKNFEAGKTKMSFELLEALVKYCDIDANDFMGMPRPITFAEDSEEKLDHHCLDLMVQGCHILYSEKLLSKDDARHGERSLYKFLNALNKKPTSAEFEKVIQMIVDSKKI